MARIRKRREGEITRVIISGRLTATDMGRIEHACAPALLANPSPLEIDLRGVTTVDQTAMAILRRIVARSARLRGGEILLQS